MIAAPAAFAADLAAVRQRELLTKARRARIVRTARPTAAARRRWYLRSVPRPATAG